MANTIGYEDGGPQTIKSDEERLAEIDAAITALLGTGQSYTVVGSRTVTRGDMEKLEKLRDKYRTRILRRKGFSGRNNPDFRGDDATANDDIPD